MIIIRGVAIKRILKKVFVGIVLGLTVFLPGTAYAHVIVTPSQARIAQDLVFNVSVPNERQVPVSSIKLLIPSGITDVTPTTKTGWAITTSSDKDSEVTSITWSGSIPAGQRQDFSFGAQAPGQATELDWKAYQTYADGTVVNWDQKPAGGDDSVGDTGPYSVTSVKDDLAHSSNNDILKSNNQSGPYIIAGLALLVALAAFANTKK